MRDLTLTNGGKRRAILAVFVAVALLGAAFALFFAPAANAARSDTDWVTVGETVLARSSDGTTKFNKNSLEALYGYLTAEGTYSSVAAAAQSGKTSADFRTLNGGKNVSVYFGGFKWDVVYLTTAQNGGGNTNKGDVILDLWRSPDELDPDKDEVKNFHGWGKSTGNVPIYPGNMYSTSQMRVITLNAGGQYSVSPGDTISDNQPQNESNQYARYTMNSVSDSLTQFIATPAEVGYQEYEWDESVSKAAIGSSYSPPQYFINDAYGEPSEGGQWGTTNFGWELNYLSNDSSRAEGAKYGSWQNDYIWLPSMTETGIAKDEANGIWDLDISFWPPDNIHYNVFCWLRSGRSTNVVYLHKKDYTTYASTSVYSAGISSSMSVRPALHLNLTQANDNSEEPSLYYTFELPDSVEFAVQDGVATATINVTASDIYVPAGKTLTLYVKDNEGLFENTFYLWNGGTKKEYTLSASGGNAVENGAFDPLYGKMIWQLSNDKTIASETFTITLTLVSPPMVAGTWQDALTFTAVVT